MANVCACGCGELLPENSTRQFKRGHKQRISETAPDGEFTEVPAGDDQVPGEPGPMTLEDAAANTPDDPEPQDRPGFKPETQIRVTAAVRRDIEGKVAFLLTMTGQMWSMPDPVCGPVLLQQSPEIAKKLTPVICQSPQLVRWFRKGTGYLIYLDLLMALWPVMQVIWLHHFVKSITVQAPASANGDRAARDKMYVVQ